jgi:hypothetical protein
MKPHHSLRSLNLFVMPLLLVGATLAAYWGVWAFEFVNLDDPAYITNNHRLADGLTYENISWSFATNDVWNWHPLTWLSYLLDAELFGIDSGAFHTTNLLLHIANTLLLYALLFRSTGAAGQSVFAAALFAIHPLHVESVAWVAERKDVLSTFFGLLALAAYGRYARFLKRRWYLTALAMFVLSLMSKQMLVTLPFLLLLLDYWPLSRTPQGELDDHPKSSPQIASTDSVEIAATTPSHRQPWRRLLLEKVPFLAISVLFCVVALLVQHQGGAMPSIARFSITTRLLNAILVYGIYLKKTFWPSGLAVYYPHPGDALSQTAIAAAALLLAALSTAAIVQWRKRPFLLVGWLWYLGTLVPVIGIVQVGAQQMADRYTYVPLIGIFIAISWGVPSLAAARPVRRVALPCVAALVLVAFMTIARGQAGHWKNSVTLFEHALAVTGENAVAHNNLGVFMAKQRQFPEAILHFRATVSIDAKFPRAQFNLGNALCSVRQYQQGANHFHKALQIEPNFAHAHFSLANALSALGRYSEAIPHFQTALQIDPDLIGAPSLLAKALREQSRANKARLPFERDKQQLPDAIQQ